MVGSVLSLLHSLHTATLGNRFIVWNTVLALVPLGLAFVLFRDHARTSVAWWCGFAVWLLFLPNAPYVLTDVVHLVDAIRDASDFDVYFGLLPLYSLFFAVGFVAYVTSLRLLRRFAATRGVHGSRWVAVEIALHAMCAIGVYLGRFVRLNSWDVIAAPGTVTATLDSLGRRFPVAVIVFTFLLFAAGTFVVNAVIDASADASGRALAVVARFRGEPRG
jgi:uncharacterized membrane protein